MNSNGTFVISPLFNICAYQGLFETSMTNGSNYAFIMNKRLTTGKNEKEYSWHVPAIKFIGMKQ